MSPKRYRFFFHFNRATKAMTIHFRGKCIIAQNVVCRVPCETKWNRIQPMLTMRGYATGVDFTLNTAVIR